MKIKVESIFYFFLLFFFIEPPFFQTIGVLNNIYVFMQIFNSFILVLLYILKKNKPSTIIWLLWIMILGLVFSCYLGYGNVKTTISTYLAYIGLSMWFDQYIRLNSKNTFDDIIFLLDLYVFIDFLSFIIYPKGMYLSQSIQKVPYVCWFLGYKNPQVRLLLPYVVLLFVRDIIFNKKISKKTYIKLLLVIGMTLFLKSATGIVGVAVFVFLYNMFSKKNNSRLKNSILKLLNIKYVYFIILILNVLVIYFNFQNYFSFLIEKVLHRNIDLTNRIRIWQRVIPIIKSHFWFGQGVLFAPLSMEYIGASHAHNYFLNIFYNGGFFMFMIISFIWLKIGKFTKYFIQSLGTRFLIFMAIIFLIMGISESLTSTIMLYPILTLIYHSKIIAEIELSRGEQ